MSNENDQAASNVASAPAKETSNATTSTTGQTGHVFADSVNVYDDQAKIAFDYFCKAAQKIIAEENAVKAEQKKVQDALAALEVERSGVIKNMILLGILIIPLLIGLFKLKKLGECKLQEENKLAALKKKFQNIKRDYQISKLDVAYVPIATEVPFEGKSFVLDDTKNAPMKEFKLTQIKEYSEFLATITAIQEKQAHTPIVESSQTPESLSVGELAPSFDRVTMFDFLGGLDRDMRSASYYLSNVIEDAISLSVVMPEDPYQKFLDEYCITDTANKTVLNVYPCDYTEELKHFNEIHEMQKELSSGGMQLDEVLKKFIYNLAEYVQLISQAKIASISKLLNASGESLLTSFKASYNHYSPELAKDEVLRMQEEDFDYQTSTAGNIKPFLLSSGSKVRYDAVSENWVTDDGTRVNAPLAIHQIQEEIISPLVQNLLKETRIERLKISNDIVDQKLNYVKEWQKEVDDFYGRGRAEGSEIINQIQLTLGEFTTAYNQFEAYKETERSLVAGEEDALKNMRISKDSQTLQVAMFKEQADQIDEQKNAFNDYVERLQNDIEVRAKEFNYTCDYESKLRDGNAKEMVMAFLSNDEELDERRKALLAANSYIAVNAKLPPEPTISEQLYEKLATDLKQVAASMVGGTYEDSELQEKVDKVNADEDDEDEELNVNAGNDEDLEEDSDIEEIDEDDEEIDEDDKDIDEDDKDIDEDDEEIDEDDEDDEEIDEDDEEIDEDDEEIDEDDEEN